MTRELGGQRGAQTLAAWGYAFSALPLMLGHLLLTSTLDQAFWLAVVLAVLRALRGDARWWAVAGAVAGVATYSRLLVAVLGVALAVGCWHSGRDRFCGARAVGGALVAGVVALPNLVFQGAHGWPQLAMGAALAENNAAEVRPLVLPFLLVMLGPVLAVVWGVGVIWLLRRPQRPRVGFLAVAFAVLVAFTLVSGAQPHYPVHLLAVMYAAGCVPVAAWLSQRAAWRTGCRGRHRSQRGALGRAGAAGGAAPRARPDLVAEEVGPLVPDQVVAAYVSQIADVYRTVPRAVGPR